MADPLFSASLIKLQRARKFIEEVAAEVRAYDDSGPATVDVLWDSQPPQVSIQYRAIGELPGAIVGDAIHNLRTALDLMASELARLNSKGDSDVYFPFATSKEELPKAIGKKHFTKCGTDAVRLLESIAPYRGGNDALRAMHDMDIQDKHTGILVTGRTMNVQLEGSYRIDGSRQHSIKVVGFNTVLIFPEGEAFGGEPVIGTLENLLQMVHGILESFRLMVEARTA